MNKYEKLIYDAIDKKNKKLCQGRLFEEYRFGYAFAWRGRIIRLRRYIMHIKLLSTAVENYDESLLTIAQIRVELFMTMETLELPTRIRIYLFGLISNFKNKIRKVLFGPILLAFE